MNYDSVCRSHARRVSRGAVWGAVFVLLVGTGCGGQRGRAGGGANAGGEEIVLEGRVSLRGSTPYSLILLEGRDGETYMVEASATGDELRRLDGMEVAVTGWRLPQTIGDTPVLAVDYYELLPLPSGERPVVGIIRADSPSAVWLITRDGTRYAIIGEFRSTLTGFLGAKVWLTGEIEFSRIELQARTIRVTDYGVIRN